MGQKFEAILCEWFIKQASNYVDNEGREFEVWWSGQGTLLEYTYVHMCMYTNDLLQSILSLYILGALHD